MLQVIQNLIHSEKAVASGLLVIASSVMVATGKITPHEWMEYTQTLLGIYVGGKTVQGAAALLSSGGKQEVEKAKANEAEAKKELADLKGAIESNDDAADAALDAKFGEEDDVPTNPGGRTADDEEEEE